MQVMEQMQKARPDLAIGPSSQCEIIVTVGRHREWRFRHPDPRSWYGECYYWEEDNVKALLSSEGTITRSNLSTNTPEAVAFMLVNAMQKFGY